VVRPFRVIDNNRDDEELEWCKCKSILQCKN
jgi:hypothetical protein